MSCETALLTHTSDRKFDTSPLYSFRGGKKSLWPGPESFSLWDTDISFQKLTQMPLRYLWEPACGSTPCSTPVPAQLLLSLHCHLVLFNWASTFQNHYSNTRRTHLSCGILKSSAEGRKQTVCVCMEEGNRTHLKENEKILKSSNLYLMRPVCLSCSFLSVPQLQWPAVFPLL